MREIGLTQGLVALIDDEDFETLSLVKWYAHQPNNSTFYAVRSVWKDGTSLRMYMHRVVLGGMGGVVDHIDGNGLNNQKSNLRLTDKSGNGKNKRAKVTNMYSAYKGVSFRKDTNRFTAHIHLGQTQKSLGCFTTAEQAAVAYDKAALESFGEFAYLNFKESSICQK